MNVLIRKGGHVQRDLWRLATAFREIMVSTTFNGSTTTITLLLMWLLLMYYLQVIEEHGYALKCLHCNLIVCLNTIGIQWLSFNNHFFVMLPVNLSGPWYEDAGVQILMEIDRQLSRDQRVIGMIIADLVTLVTLTASAVVSAVAPTPRVQTAHFVNDSSCNVHFGICSVFLFHSHLCSIFFQSAYDSDSNNSSTSNHNPELKFKNKEGGTVRN